MNYAPPVAFYIPENALKDSPNRKMSGPEVNPNFEGVTFGNVENKSNESLTAVNECVNSQEGQQIFFMDRSKSDLQNQVQFFVMVISKPNLLFQKNFAYQES